MTLRSLKRDIRRIKRSKSSDFDEIVYERAMDRHDARKCILLAEKLADAFDAIDALPKPGSNSDYWGASGKKTSVAMHEDATEAKNMLGEDTPETWGKDHKIIEAYQKKHHGIGHRYYRGSPFGKNPTEMWEHYCSDLFISMNEHLDMEIAQQEKTKKEIEEMEAKYGKPVKLIPQFGDSTFKCYTPEFKGGIMGWGLGHLFPYSDYPDHDGKSAIVLDDSE